MHSRGTHCDIPKSLHLSVIANDLLISLFPLLGKEEGKDCNDMSPSHARRVKRSRLFRHATSALPAKHWRRAPFYAFMDAKVSNRRPRHHKPSFTGSVSVLCFSQYAHGPSLLVTAALFRSLIVEAVFHEKGLAYDVCRG